MRYTATNSSVSEYGAAWWSASEPTMPPSSSLSSMNVEELLSPHPTRPDQFTFIAALMTGCGTMAGVHSTV